MLKLADLPRLQNLATQRELLKKQLTTLRALHIAVVGPASVLVTHFPANLKAPVIVSEELFTVVEAQLMRALSVLERELMQFDVQPIDHSGKEQVRNAA